MLFLLKPLPEEKHPVALMASEQDLHIQLIRLHMQEQNPDLFLLHHLAVQVLFEILQGYIVQDKIFLPGKAYKFQGLLPVFW